MDLSTITSNIWIVGSIAFVAGLIWGFVLYLFFTYFRRRRRKKYTLPQLREIVSTGYGGLQTASKSFREINNVLNEVSENV